nr:hypothetical protein [Micromonospora sp. DSM 115978]
MFGFGRRRSHGQLAKAELGEGLDHLRQAATHAAGGVGAAVGPRVDAARRYVTPTATRVRNTAAVGWGATVSAVGPLAVAAADGARQAGSTAGRSDAAKAARARARSAARTARDRTGRGRARRSRRWPALAGLLAVGAAVGAAGVIALRRRRQAEWDSYDPAPALDTLPSEAVPVLAHASADPGRDRGSTNTAGTAATPAKTGTPATPAKTGTPATSTRASAADDKVGAAAAAPTTPIAESAKQAAAKSDGPTDGGLGRVATPNGRA